MKTAIIIFALGVLLLTSCKKDDSGTYAQEDQQRFVATDVLVKTRAGFTTQQVFDFINAFDHEVGCITPDQYVSGLPREKLDDVLGHFANKPYTNPNMPVYGHVQAETQRIIIFPRLYSIKNVSNQEQWIAAMQELELDDKNIGFTIHFHVPEGKEKKWVSLFKQYPLVQWAELNGIMTAQSL